jgi:hypothetical protein
MAKKSKRSNRLLTTNASTPAPAIPFEPNDPKLQALFKIRMKRWLLLALIFAFLPICTLLGRYSMDLMA